ncbi:membrane dipeptidase [Oscillospiraceae bacterium MB08-C2-2]|nr:membrane dipeptidase [Oscillospiraceae bacterium MB08-C2-2]
MDERRIIDLHCDTLTLCRDEKLDITSDRLHINLNKLPEGYRWCQAFAIFMPDAYRGRAAVEYFNALLETYRQQMCKHRNRIRTVERLKCIDQALDCCKWAAFLTVEGGSALAGELSRVAVLYEAGVRIMTLTWNAANEIAGGAATDEGFTPFGRQAVGEMERLGMAVDVSHLSDRAFWELCEFATKPFLATHSNSRVICPHRRNLTDAMFDEIVRRGGIVGMNYYRPFIREDGEHGTVKDLLYHIHHFLERGGENTIALGSDYDGADVPDYLHGVGTVDFLVQAMLKSGIPQQVVDKILFQNARNYLANL